MPIPPIGIDLTFLPSVKIPTADAQRDLGTGHVDAGVRLLATRSFTKTQQLHFNIGYTWVGKPHGEQLRDVVFVGIAGETNIPGLAAERSQVVAEVFGKTKEEANGRSDIQGRVGLHYQLVEDFILDAAMAEA